jgi:hypothetical protein
MTLAALLAVYGNSCLRCIHAFPKLGTLLNELKRSKIWICIKSKHFCFCMADIRITDQFYRLTEGFPESIHELEQVAFVVSPFRYALAGIGIVGMFLVRVRFNIVTSCGKPVCT